MLYGEYDEHGRLIAVYTTAREPGQQPVTNAELQEFLDSSREDQSYKELLRELDLGMVRVLEDLIDLLISKNVIMFTDLPEQVRTKLNQRKAIRSKLQEEDDFMVDDII